MSQTGLNPLPHSLKYGLKLNSCHFLDFRGAKKVSDSNIRMSAHYSKFQTITISFHPQVSVCSSGVLLLLHLPVCVCMRVFVCVCPNVFPALCGKILHVCLVSEEVDLSNTHRAELSRSDSSTTQASQVTPILTRQRQSAVQKKKKWKKKAFGSVFPLSNLPFQSFKQVIVTSTTSLFWNLVWQSIYSHTKINKEERREPFSSPEWDRIVHNHHHSKISVQPDQTSKQTNCIPSKLWQQ